jgi:hypothetical protein
VTFRTHYIISPITHTYLTLYIDHARRRIERSLRTLQNSISFTTQILQLFNIIFTTCFGITLQLSNSCTYKKFMSKNWSSFVYVNFASLKVFLIFLIQFFQKYGLPLLKYVNFLLNGYFLLKLYIFYPAICKRRRVLKQLLERLNIVLNFFYSAQNGPFDLLPNKNVTVRISNCVFEE